VSLPEGTIIAAMKILGEEENTKEKPEQPATDRGNNNQQYRTNENNKRGEAQQSSTPQTEQINQVSINADQQAGPSNSEKHAINLLSTTSSSISPYLKCEIEGEEMLLLVDTGATVSVLTKEVIDVITQKNHRIPQLPVTGIQISNAVGKKICKVSKQIFCECKIGNIYLQTNFIQVEGLNEIGIIGADMLNKYSAQIKFNKQTVQFNVNDVSVTVPFANRETRDPTPMTSLGVTKIEKRDKVETSSESSHPSETDSDTIIRAIKDMVSQHPGSTEEIRRSILEAKNYLKDFEGVSKTRLKKLLYKERLKHIRDSKRQRKP